MRTLKGLGTKPREVTFPRICLEGVCLQMVIHQLINLIMPLQNRNINTADKHKNCNKVFWEGCSPYH